MMALSSSQASGMPQGSSAAAAAAAAAAQAAESYSSFPAVKINEALSILRELNLHLGDEDILKPQPAVVLKVFCAFLEALSGITMEWIERQKYINLGQMEYKNIYDDGMFWMMIFREIRAMMISSQIADFQMQDLTRPQPKRFKRQLSALVNFYRFRQDRVSEFEQLNGEADELDLRRQELRAEVEMLAARLEEEKERRLAEEPQVKTLKEDNAKHREALLKLKRDQAKYMADIETWKKEKSDMVTKQTKLTEAIQDLSTEIRKLQGRIVESPQELREALDRLERECKDEAKIKIEIQERLDKLSARTTRLHDLQKEAQLYLTLVQDASKVHQEVEAALASLEAQQASTTALEEVRNNAARDLERDLRKQEHSQQRYDRVEANLRALQEKLERESDGAQNALVETQAIREAMQREIDELDEQANALEKEYTTIMKDFDKAQAEAIKERNDLNELANRYIDQLEGRFHLD